MPDLTGSDAAEVAARVHLVVFRGAPSDIPRLDYPLALEVAPALEVDQHDIGDFLARHGVHPDAVGDADHSPHVSALVILDEDHPDGGLPGQIASAEYSLPAAQYAALQADMAERGLSTCIRSTEAGRRKESQ